MAWYLVKRLLQLIPVFFGATLLVYFLVFMTPGDPLDALCGDKGCTPGVAAALTEQYHLNDPFFVQYFSYIGGLLTGDLGVNFSGREISEVLADAFPATVRLAIIALVFEAIFGITFGLYAGLKKGGWFDSTVLVVSLIVIAVPIFVLGFVMQYFVGVKWGLAKPTVSGAADWSDLILPGIVLGQRGLRAHRNGQGPDPRPCDPGAHPAQLDDPRGHLPGHGPGSSDGRRDRHRGHLQRPRHRQSAVQGPDPRGRTHGRLRGVRDGHHLLRGQSAG